MALGRITGPLLKANLLRQGVDLAFETNLLYLDVKNGRVGVKTASPTHDLQVAGTTRTTNLEVTTRADIATFTIQGNTIASSSSTINLDPSGVNPVVYQGTIVTGQLNLYNNIIATTGTNTNLTISTTGTGQVNINSNVLVNGDLHATGTITADGNIQLGDTNTDGIIFNADITSNIIPDLNNHYDLGAIDKTWRTVYANNLNTSNITATSVIANGIELTQVQGKIYYVATNGNDTNAGQHENNPLASVKYALSLATSGDQVFLYPGTYTEIFPLTIPAGVTLRGSGLRASVIQPTVGTIDKDAILLNGQTTVEDISITGYRYNSGNDTGYAFRFASGIQTTSRSPYVRNVTVITRGSTTSAGDPYGFDAGDAGRGIFLDGSAFTSANVEVACLFHSVTLIVPAQVGIKITNGVRVEWLNSFTYFADKGIYIVSGSLGAASAGHTNLRIDNRTGTWSVGNTVKYYDTNGSTLLASGVISSINGNFISLTGKCSGFQTVTDRLTKTVNVNGNAQLSTIQKKFGTASLALDGTGDFVTVASTPDFAFGTGEWTVEMWVYRTGGSGAIQVLADFRSANPQVVPVLYLSATNYYPSLTVNGATVISGTTGVQENQWTHIAVSKSGTSTKVFINGGQTGSTYTDTNNYIQGPLTLGARFDGTTAFYGYIDDLRITKGLGRYTGVFVPASTAVSSDLNTVLLLHFNGINTSTTILDDGITLQDVRSYNGASLVGTASIINFADYSDFGGEFRSIGSACVYGNYGIYGDGEGVIAYLISQNFAYIGAGKLSTNDPNDRIPAQEAVKLNRAKIYYTSVDNEGNFKVGDAFSVNQKTGEVIFNGQQLSITTLSGITFSDGTHSTVITPQEIDTGNIRISGNTVESITGDIIVTANSGAINLQNDTRISGNLVTSAGLNVNGNTILGDSSSDTINFVGGINTDIIPSLTATYNLGNSVTPLRWNNVYLNRAEIDGLVIDNNTISTTLGNDDLTFTANGTGRVYFPNNNVQLDQSLTVTNNLTVTTGTTYLKDVGVNGIITQTGDINQTGNFTTSGLTQVTGNITGTGYLQLPVITISGNNISTTTTNTDLQLVANGTGNVVFEGLLVSNNEIQSTATNSSITLSPQGSGIVNINSNQSLKIPVGTSLEQPASPTAGMIRYNTTVGRYEGWVGTYWQQLGGVIDVAGQTYITPELTPGAGDNIIRFYTAGSVRATLDASKLSTATIETNNIRISDNTISTVVSGTDINITTPGLGGVRLGNLQIKNNTITNLVAGAITEFVETGDGYVKIGGHSGVVIPAGDTANDRPGIVETGMMRFNTVLQLVEIYNGVTWTSVAGTSGGVTANDATDIGIVTALLFG